ncbi:hypothetical protein BUALT_Bualt02G0001100 [Buddleja alternifolia]|uniref:Uncharacterized protein n=1 Tax=Buddleja alternifolia TaxID=168488 RepID=A0AAV6Y4P6_9LAMI|nr:hypothetical protein BUALT_Bualt02G0001100 [Buddleja alternifolia]
MEEEGGEEYLFKIVVIGDSAVGKSNLLSRFARDEFDHNSKATIGVEFQTQVVEIDGKEVKAQVGVGSRKHIIVSSDNLVSLIGGGGAFDVRRVSSLNEHAKFVNKEVGIYAHCDTTVARMLVGNKCDLENIREVSVEEGKSLAEEEGLFFTETSALDSTNVQKAFEIVIREIYEKVSRKVLNSDSYKAQLSVNRVGVDLTKQNKSSFSCCSQ